MKNSIFLRGISFCVLLFLFILIPNINVQAEANKNFSVKVETDKNEYSKDEVVTYKVTIKNVSDKNSKDIILSDELPARSIALTINTYLPDSLISPP